MYKNKWDWSQLQLPSLWQLGLLVLRESRVQDMISLASARRWANLSLAGSPAPSKISLINNDFSFSLAAFVGRMQQSRRLKAQLSKALHHTALLSNIAGLWRKTKPGDEHSWGRTHCRVVNNKLQDNKLHYILDPTLPPHRLSASPRFTHWSCSRIHTSMKADITSITHAH